MLGWSERSMSSIGVCICFAPRLFEYRQFNYIKDMSDMGKIVERKVWGIIEYGQLTRAFAWLRTRSAYLSAACDLCEQTCSILICSSHTLAMRTASSGSQFLFALNFEAWTPCILQQCCHCASNQWDSITDMQEPLALVKCTIHAVSRTFTICDSKPIFGNFGKLRLRSFSNSMPGQNAVLCPI